MESSGAKTINEVRYSNRKTEDASWKLKGRKFKNGQQQIAIIVGYHENVLKNDHEDKIKRNGTMQK